MNTIYQYISWNSTEKFDSLVNDFPTILKEKISTTVPSKKTNNVFVSHVNLFKKDKMFNEMYSLPMNLYFIVLGLKMLKKGGNLYYFYASSKYETRCQMLDIVRSKFKDYKFIKNNFQNRNGVYKFTNYNGNHKDLEQILKEYMKMDKTLGQKYIDNEDSEHIFFNFGTTIDENFLTYLKNIATNKHDEYLEFLQKADYISTMIKKPKKNSTNY